MLLKIHIKGDAFQTISQNVNLLAESIEILTFVMDVGDIYAMLVELGFLTLLVVVALGTVVVHGTGICNTIWHKFLMGKILTNLTSFYQFVNIFPIKFFH